MPVFTVHPKYTTQSPWHLRPSEVATHASYFTVVKSILLREHLLLKLKQLVVDLDKSYWVYGCLRIAHADKFSAAVAAKAAVVSATAGNEDTVTTASVVSEAHADIDKTMVQITRQTLYAQEKLLQLQDELAVALAHLRSASLFTVQAIEDWRALALREKPTSAGLSIMWNGDNYLCKMLTDALFVTTDIMYEAPYCHYINKTYLLYILST